MKKLKLDVEILRVESFETAPTADARGTVQGHNASVLAHTCACNTISCPYSYSCDQDTDTEPDTNTNNPYTVIVW
jgi:hypothetical protein